MLCSRCKKNEATVEMVQVINDKRFESRLCPMCYAEMYGGLHSTANVDLLASLLGNGARHTKTCPVCGLSYGEYEKTGLLGCASCYDVFKEQLVPVIKRIQGKTEHVGKVGTNNDELGLHRRLKSLQEQLERALREKRFKDAGNLKGQISVISKTLYGENGGKKDD